MKNPTTLGIVEDCPFVRQAMVCLLKTYNTFNVLFDAGNEKELFKKLKSEKPDVILINVVTSLTAGQKILRQMNEKHPGLKIIMVSMPYEESIVSEFIQLGARAFLPKNCDISLVVETISKVQELGYFFDSSVSLLLAKGRSKTKLPTQANDSRKDFTTRELEILAQICLNKTNKEIADTLSLSIRTVEGHRLKLMKKTKSKNAMALTHFAASNNLLSA